MQIPKKRVHVAAAAGLVVVVGAGAAWTWTSTTSSTAAAQYLTATAAKGNVISSVSATGYVEPELQVTLGFKNAGRVAKVMITPGQAVEAGQLLATQETQDLEAQLAQAEANLKSANAKLDGLIQGAGEADLAVSRAAVASARVNLESARANLTNAEQKATVDQANSERSLSYAQEAAATNLITYESDHRLYQEAEAAYQEALRTQESLQEEYNQLKESQVLAQQRISAAQTAYNEAVSTYGVRSPRGVETAEILRKAQLELDQANTQLTLAQFRLDSARTTTSQKQSDYNYRLNLASQGKSRVDADKSLLEKERASAQLAPVVTKQAVDAARNQVAQAEASLATAEANYAKALAGASDPEIRAGQAAVEQAEATLLLAKGNLAGAKILAPFGGVVATVTLTPGQLVGAGGSGGSIVLISQGLRVLAQVNEADIAKTSVGQKANYTFNAYPSRPFTGQVLSVAPKATTVSSVQLFEVMLSLENAPPNMKAGLPANVQITVAERNGVVTVPRSAVSYAQAYLASQNAGKAPAPSAGTPPQGTGTGTPGNPPPGVTPGSGAGKGSGMGGGTGVPGSGPGAGAAGANKAPSVILVQEANGKIVPVTVQLGLSDAKNQEVISGLSEGAVVVTGIKTTATKSSSSSSSLIPVSTPGPGGGGMR